MSTENTRYTAKISNPASSFILQAENNNSIAIIEPYRHLFSWKYRTVSYSDFSRNSVNFANLLKNKYNIGEGSKVLLMYPFSIELYIAVTALLLLGASIVFIEPWMGRKLFSKLTADLNTGLCIISARNSLLLRAAGHLKNVPDTQNVRVDQFITDKFKFREQEDSDRPAIFTFTTGSSGVPKQVIRTYSDIINQSVSLGKHIDKSANGDLITFPNLVLLNLQRNIPVAIPHSGFKGNSALSPNIIEGLHDRFSVTGMFISSSLLISLADKPVMKNMKSIFAGGSIVIPEFLEKHGLCEKTTVFYGSTEIEPIAVNDHIHADSDSGINAGMPVPDIAVAVAEKDSRGIGEIVVTQGNRTIATGDLGYLNETGNIILMGRAIDSPEYRGIRIYPYEIARENARLGYFNTVIPIVKGDRLIIVVEDNVISQEVRETFRKLNIEPDKFIRMKTIPRDPRHRAKIDYRRLFEII